MTVRKIPGESRRWTGIYPGNYYGSLWRTFNVDLHKHRGHVTLSQRMEIVADSDDGLTDPAMAFLQTDADCEDRFWALFRDGLLRTDTSGFETPDTTWATDSLDSSPTNKLADFTVHMNDSRNDSGRNKLIVTTDTDIWVLNDTGDNQWTGNWWGTKQGQPKFAYEATVQRHPIHFFPFRKISLVGDGNLIHTIHRPSDTQNDTVTNSRLVLPSQYVAWHIFSTKDRVWVCLANRNSPETAMVEWDGFSESYNNLYKVKGKVVLSGVDYYGTPIILSSAGNFLEFSGNEFVPLIRNGKRLEFPSAQNPDLFMSSSSTLSAFVSVEPRGMTLAEDGLIYVASSAANLESRSGGQHNAGIWCLDPIEGNIYNRYAYSSTLGDSADDTSYGHGFVNASGAGAIFAAPKHPYSRELLASATIEDSGDVDRTKIWLVDGANWGGSVDANRGHIITQFVSADKVAEMWDSIWLRYKEFKSGSNSFVVKARGTRTLTDSLGDYALQGNITWTSTTTFTYTAGSTSDDELQVGDEVEILSGSNPGYIVHITEISGAHGALQTITTDEAVVSGSGQSRALFDRWKKLGTISSLNRDYQKLSIGIDSSFIQFKIELRGLPGEMELKDLVVTSKNSLDIEN